MPRTFRITTLGCRVNHAETRDLESILRERGLEPSPAGEPADLEVVHSCSVTNQAAAKSRQAIRRAARRTSPSRSPHVVVTGCFAGTDPDDAQRAAGPGGAVIPHASDDDSTTADRFARDVDRWLDGEGTPNPVRIATAGSSGASGVIPLPVVPLRAAGAHVRAELRIQDGCDAHCTFCIIPRTRPALRSKRVADAVEEARRLVEHGHREIVLSGVFIGAYGHETALRRRQARPRAEPLADLLDEVARVPGLERLRISSMEPGDVTPALLDAMVANRPVVVPHLHLPLQSGSDRVLRRMNRQYGRDDYLAMIDAVHAALDEDGLPPALTTDVICGFPGETEDDFAETVDVARRAGFLHMHVFPFSARRGTAAARWTDRFVPELEKRRRVRALIDLEEDPGDGLAIRFRRRLLGRRVRVIVEHAARDEPGTVVGRCDHYERVHLRTTAPRGSVIEGTVTAVTPERTEVEAEGRRVPLAVVDQGAHATAK